MREAPVRKHRAWALIIVLAAVACGGSESPEHGAASETDATRTPADTCSASTLDYENFGARFFLSWCTGCHSGALEEKERQKAPVGVDFDNIDAIRAKKDRISARAVEANATMPPAGGPSAKERAMLSEWLACGAK